VALRVRSTTRRRSRRRLWLLAVGVGLAALLYYRPVHSYLRTRDALAEKKAEVRGLAAENQDLAGHLALAGSATTLVRRARRLGLVKPGERLFIVKGIAVWRKARRPAGDSR
jgi:cell division protein FtsB